MYAFQLKAKYTQGGWSGRLVSDYVEFPTVSATGSVKTDVVLITEAYDLFANGSGWQVSNKCSCYGTINNIE